MENQHTAIAEFFITPEDKSSQNDQFYKTQDSHDGTFLDGNRIKLFEYLGGMAGIDELVERPHQHYDKYADAHQKQG